MKKAKCLLCNNHNAMSALYIKDPNARDLYRGRKYDCPNCGSYAIADKLHDWIENFLKNKPEEKKEISNYLKEQQGGDPPYIHLTKKL
jgi:hypothetical protein